MTMSDSSNSGMLDSKFELTKLDSITCNPEIDLYIKRVEFELSKTRPNLVRTEPYSYPPITIKKNHKIFKILWFLDFSR